MEIAVEGIGSLGGGGRYDGLIGMFSGEQIPACGFSLGLERILVVMAERNMFPPTRPGRRAGRAGHDLRSGVDRGFAARWRRSFAPRGLRAELYPEPDKLGKQFKYAVGARRGVRRGRRRRRARPRRGHDQEHEDRRTALGPAIRRRPPSPRSESGAGQSASVQA